MNEQKNGAQKKYALIIIDMQNDFVLPNAPAYVPNAYETIPVLKELLSFARHKQFPVFHVIREYRNDGSDIEFTKLHDFLTNNKYAVPGTQGCNVVSDLMPVKGEYTIIKNRFSAFMNTELDLMLRRKGITDLIICGTQYPNCIRATIFDAIALGYFVTNITDATSAKTQEIADSNIVDITNIGVTCVNFKEFKRMLEQ